MRRRDFITLLGGATLSKLAGPLPLNAQQSARSVIGFLSSTSKDGAAPYIAGLGRGLSEVGYAEGRNLEIEFRWADGNYERLPALAEELVRLNVDVLVTHGAAGALAAKNATSTVPIVITAVGDMLALGLVSSLARPGGRARKAVALPRAVSPRLGARDACFAGGDRAPLPSRAPGRGDRSGRALRRALGGLGVLWGALVFSLALFAY